MSNAASIGSSAMRTLIRLLHAMSLAMLALVGASAAPDEPRTAPPLTATLLDGKRFALAEHPGRVVLVNFWATWCAPCREEMPALETFYRKYRERGLELVAISLDEPRDLPAVQEVMRRYSFPAALAGQAEFGGYGRIWRVPMTFVIDRHGRLREDLMAGVLQVDLDFLERRVAPLVGP
jgi:thiol-disulfide isomerase/thioredoxin